MTGEERRSNRDRCEAALKAFLKALVSGVLTPLVVRAGRASRKRGTRAANQEFLQEGVPAYRL